MLPLETIVTAIVANKLMIVNKIPDFCNVLSSLNLSLKPTANINEPANEPKPKSTCKTINNISILAPPFPSLLKNIQDVLGKHNSFVFCTTDHFSYSCTTIKFRLSLMWANFLAGLSYKWGCKLYSLIFYNVSFFKRDRTNAIQTEINDGKTKMISLLGSVRFSWLISLALKFYFFKIPELSN